MYAIYQTRLHVHVCYLFLFLSAGLMCIKLASSRADELFYVTSTQPPNPECPKDHLCQTLQYYLQNRATSSKGATLMFLSGNHIVPPCYCTRFLHIYDYLSMVGLDGNIIIHNLLDTIFNIVQLSLKNIMFYNGKLIIASRSVIQLHVDSVQLIDCALSISNAELGEIVRLQAHNSQVSIASSNNMIFTSCTFDEIPWPMAYYPIEAAVIIDRSHNITFSDNSKFYRNHNSALISYSSVITLAGSVSFLNNSGIRGGAITLESIVNAKSCLWCKCFIHQQFSTRDRRCYTCRTRSNQNARMRVLLPNRG